MKISRIKVWFKENLISALMILGVILGLIFGFILRFSFTISPQVLIYVGLPGNLLMRFFKMLLIPLIVASLSTGISATKIDQNKGLIGLSMLLIVLFTTTVSIIGVIMAVSLRPGVRTGHNNEIYEVKASHIKSDTKPKTTQNDIIYEFFLNLFPDNIVGAAIMTDYTDFVPINAQNLSEGYKKVIEKSFQPNLLGLVTFSIVLGLALLQLQERAHTIKKVLEETNYVVMQIINGVMKLMPIGMFSWMCVEGIKMKAPDMTIFIQLAWFAATAGLALLSIWFILYPAAYFIVLRKNPFKMYHDILPAILLAIGSSSSAITLPVTMKCMEEENKLALPISRFFLPLAMNMHMPGTATFGSIIGIFMAQMNGVPLSFPMLCMIGIYSVVLSMAFPATPSQGGIIFFVTICAIIDIENPLELLAYVSTLDLLMGRLRTAINVTGDCVIACIVEKYCYNEQKITENHESNTELNL